MVGNTKIVWDLCGGSQNSVYNSLKNNKEFEVYTFDTNTKIEHSGQCVVDLTSPDIIEYLKSFPRPDIIVASPLCQSFSFILNAGIKEFNERLAWKYNPQSEKYELRDVAEIEELKNKSNFLKQNKSDLIRERAILGDKLLNSVLKIIEYFVPKYWYIENPRNSLMWNFISFNYENEYYFLAEGQYNDCYYYCYSNEFSMKPTRFMSNVKMNLKKYTIPKDKRKNKKIYNMNGGNETGARVKIPHELIKHIFTYFK